MTDDPLEALYYLSRPSAMLGYPAQPARAVLPPSAVRCICWRVQNGEDEAAISVEWAGRFDRIGQGLKHSLAAVGVVEQRFEPRLAAVHRKLDLMERPFLKPLFDDIAHIFQLYDDLAKLEWDQLTSSVRDPFRSKAKEAGMAGWRYYQRVRPLYYKNGYRHPPTYLNQIRGNVRFLNRDLVGGAHPELARRLKVAEKEFHVLSKQAGTQWTVRQRAIGCFVPRGTISGGFSNHALGLAIDIDYETNPFLHGKQAALLDEIVAWMFDRRLINRRISLKKSWVQAPLIIGPQIQDHEAREIYANTRDASNAVRQMLTNYLANWAARKRAKKPPPQSSPAGEAHAYIERMVALWGGRNKSANPSDWRGYKALTKLQKEGFVTLPMQLFIAMERAGIKSGLKFTSGKDVMHFEVPHKSVYKLAPPKPPRC